MSGTETRAGEAEAVEALTEKLRVYVAGPGSIGWGLGVAEIVALVHPIIAAAVRADHGEQIAQRIETEAERLYGGLSGLDMHERTFVGAMKRAARLARGASS